MKLYYSPFACSLAAHIGLREAGLSFDLERVDLKGHRTEAGSDFYEINPKGYVPVLVLDDGEVLTENVAVLDWIATTAPALSVPGPLGRTRLLETLSYIATELHRAFKPIWQNGSSEEKDKAKATVAGLLAFLGASVRGDFLFGSEPSVADCYLFVMLLWADRCGIEAPDQLVALRQRMANRPAVQAALHFESSPTEASSAS